MFLVPLLLGCAAGPNSKEAAPIAWYDAGWPIDACSTDFPEEGTGYAVGDVLPQHTFLSQSDEAVSLHDWCNHVVYIEIGHFT